MGKRLVLSLFLASLLSAQSKNIILITADGLRWQELFTGVDPLLMNEKAAGMKDAADLRKRLWKDTPEDRRKALLPFFWGELAARGVVYGNVKKGSSVRVTNGRRVSYPGYSEILTGRANDEQIKGNDHIQNPNQTVLEFLKERLKLKSSQVALFGTWETFHWIAEKTPGSIFINAGVRAYDGPSASAKMRELSRLQGLIITPWDGERNDVFTFEMAMEYLRAVKPRVLHIAFGETDDWAHDKRYDRVLPLISYFDRCLKELFAAIDSMPEYKGKTSVVITSDHGRGSKLDDWSGHGEKVPEANQIWMALFGPGTAAVGEAANVPEIYQRDVTPTMIQMMGIDPAEMKGVLGKAIRVK